jgi:hypothetical protein
MKIERHETGAAPLWQTALAAAQRATTPEGSLAVLFSAARPVTPW